jgi:hypothetical protein
MTSCPTFNENRMPPLYIVSVRDFWCGGTAHVCGGACEVDASDAHHTSHGFAASSTGPHPAQHLLLLPRERRHPARRIRFVLCKDFET